MPHSLIAEVLIDPLLMTTRRYVALCAGVGADSEPADLYPIGCEPEALLLGQHVGGRCGEATLLG